MGGRRGRVPVVMIKMNSIVDDLVDSRILTPCLAFYQSETYYSTHALDDPEGHEMPLLQSSG